MSFTAQNCGWSQKLFNVDTRYSTDQVQLRWYPCWAARQAPAVVQRIVLRTLASSCFSGKAGQVADWS